MKIAILTQPLRTNFGGILQNYALHTVLRKLGNEPITIDYDCRYPKWRWMMGRMKSILTRTNHHIEFPHYGRSGQENLNRFIHNNINMTNPVDVPSKEVIGVINPDAIIVGSDQVWAPACNVPIDYLGNMFLDFAPDFKGKRVAYAASFGSGEWTYTLEWTEKCSKLAKKFDAISVREESGVRLCKEHLGVDAIHVLDPTLLLTGADYENLLSRPAKKTNTLFAYVLDTSDEKVKFLHNVANQFGLDLKIQGANDDLKWEDSIEDWLADIRDAAMVVTDSFHGSVFAIQFHRPFLSILNHKRGADRFTSLLGVLDLTDRLIYDVTSIEDITNQIDWSAVDERLEGERCKSLEFLKNALWIY